MTVAQFSGIREEKVLRWKANPRFPVNSKGGTIPLFITSARLRNHPPPFAEYLRTIRCSVNYLTAAKRNSHRDVLIPIRESMAAV